MSLVLAMAALVIWIILMVTLVIAAVTVVGTGRIPWTAPPGRRRHTGHRMRASLGRRTPRTR
jgi:hypothetical protein